MFAGIPSEIPSAVGLLPCFYPSLNFIMAECSVRSYCRRETRRVILFPTTNSMDGGCCSRKWLENWKGISKNVDESLRNRNRDDFEENDH